MAEKAVDELVWQVADEADGVREQQLVAVGLDPAGGGVEGLEEGVVGAHARVRQGVHQARLAGVGVAGEGDARQGRRRPPLALDRARAGDVAQAPAQGRHAAAQEAPVGLELRLAGAPRADPAAEPLEVLPEPLLARVGVLELGELDLQLALCRVRVLGEDVEDHGGAVDDARLQAVLERALLPGAQRALGRHEVGLEALHGRLQVLEAPAAQVGARLRPVAPLHDGLGDLGARRPQQLAELGQPVALLLGVARERGDDDRPLATAPLGRLLRARGRASVGPLDLRHRSMMPATGRPCATVRSCRNPSARRAGSTTIRAVISGEALQGLDEAPDWYKDAVIYELHVRAFHDSNGDGIGDFRGLTAEARLPAGPRRHRHLAAAVLPVAAAATTATTSPTTPTSTRPTARCDDFKAFLDEAHRRGLRVITELVLNHTSDQHPWFQRARRAPPGSRRARLLRLERHAREVHATRASSSRTSSRRTGPGTRSPRPTTGTASTRTSPT